MADMMKDLKDFAQEYYLSILKEITHPPRVAVGAGDLGPSLFRVAPDAEGFREDCCSAPSLPRAAPSPRSTRRAAARPAAATSRFGFFERYDVACVAAEIRNRYGVGGPGEAPLILYGRGAGAVAALLFADRGDHDAACAAETPSVLSLECKAPEKDHALAGARFQPTTMFFNVSKPALKVARPRAARRTPAFRATGGGAFPSFLLLDAPWCTVRGLVFDGIAASKSEMTDMPDWKLQALATPVVSASLPIVLHSIQKRTLADLGAIDGRKTAGRVTAPALVVADTHRDDAARWRASLFPTPCYRDDARLALHAALETFLGPDDEPPIPGLAARTAAWSDFGVGEDELEYVFDAGGPGRPEREHAYAATPPPCVLRKKPPRKSISRASRRSAEDAREEEGMGARRLAAPAGRARGARAPPRPPPVPPAWVFHYEFARRALDEDEEEFGEDPRRPAESGEDPRRR
ncbi:hypothetical protein SO694_0000274 [Aureococcus anophagefferens]|uniref:Serine aminopeptidase S33 domain-containing protein n=1 Tax=Aureococcus anophagefferens TaxID=44056 RepID=A0ABR1GCR5_AURAN